MLDPASREQLNPEPSFSLVGLRPPPPGRAGRENGLTFLHAKTGGPPEEQKGSFGKHLGSGWDPKITKNRQKYGSKGPLAETSEKEVVFLRSWDGWTLEN